MQKLYKLSEVENQIGFLMLMGFNVHVTVLRESIDFERLIDMVQDKLGFFRRLFGYARPRFFRDLRSQGNFVVITLHSMDVPPDMDKGDYVFYILGQHVKIVSFVCDKRIDIPFNTSRLRIEIQLLTEKPLPTGIQLPKRLSSYSNVYLKGVPIPPSQDVRKITAEIPNWFLWGGGKVETTESISSLPDDWQLKIFAYTKEHETVLL